MKRKRIAILVIAGLLILCLAPQSFGGKVQWLECWNFLHEVNGWVLINTDYREFTGVEAVDKAGNVHSVAFQPGGFKIPGSKKFKEIKVSIQDKTLKEEFEWNLTFPLASKNQRDEL